MIATTSVIIASMLTGYTAIALEIIKIGGAALLAYTAGFSNGKTNAQDAREQHKDE